MNSFVEWLAPAKINLGLRITGRRSDGFHDIESIFAPLALHDRLRVELADEDSFICSDPSLPHGPDNLVLRARDAFREHCTKTAASRQPLKILLEKRIPAGAGLGGGSSDAASCLLAINQLLDSPLKTSLLQKICLLIGSDVLYFLTPEWMHVSGRGEVLHPVSPVFQGHVLLVWPDLSISTAQAYAALSGTLTAQRGFARFVGFHGFIGDTADPASWPENMFEEVVFREAPLLAEIKQQLLDLGALYASMSGSGSTVYGFFDSEGSVLRAEECFARRFPCTIRTCTT